MASLLRAGGTAKQAWRASQTAALFRSGTESSNPLPSSGESGTNRRRRTPWCRDRKNEHVWQAAWTEIIQDKATPQAAAEKAFKRVEERWRRIIRDR
jgi:hypothetical protein